MAQPDFGKVFGNALRYPLHLRTFLPQLVLSLFLYAVIYVFFSLPFLQAGIDMTSMEQVTEYIFTTLLPSILWSAPFFIIFFIASTFLGIMYYNNSMVFHSKGKREPLGSSLSVAKQRFVPLLKTTVIVMVIALACLSGFFLVAYSIFFNFNLALIATGAIAGIAGIVILVFIFLWWLYFPLVCIFTKKDGFEALRESKRVFKKNVSSTILFLIIFFVISYIIGMVTGGVVGLVSFLLLLPSGGNALAMISPYLIPFNALFNTYTTLFAWSAFSALYNEVKK